MQVTWILPDGRAVTADVGEGVSMMTAAVANRIPAILGECGGSLSCATCHVYVDAAWLARTGTVGDFEDQMLEVAEAARRPSSRLSCQIRMERDLDGLVLHVPQP